MDYQNFVQIVTSMLQEANRDESEAVYLEFVQSDLQLAIKYLQQLLQTPSYTKVGATLLQSLLHFRNKDFIKQNLEFLIENLIEIVKFLLTNHECDDISLEISSRILAYYLSEAWPDSFNFLLSCNNKNSIYCIAYLLEINIYDIEQCIEACNTLLIEYFRLDKYVDVHDSIFCLLKTLMKKNTEIYLAFHERVIEYMPTVDTNHINCYIRHLLFYYKHANELFDNGKLLEFLLSVLGSDVDISAKYYSFKLLNRIVDNIDEKMLLQFLEELISIFLNQIDGNVSDDFENSLYSEYKELLSNIICKVMPHAVNLISFDGEWKQVFISVLISNILGENSDFINQEIIEYLINCINSDVPIIRYEVSQFFSIDNDEIYKFSETIIQLIIEQLLNEENQTIAEKYFDSLSNLVENCNQNLMNIKDNLLELIDHFNKFSYFIPANLDLIRSIIYNFGEDFGEIYEYLQEFLKNVIEDQTFLHDIAFVISAMNIEYKDDELFQLFYQTVSNLDLNSFPKNSVVDIYRITAKLFCQLPEIEFIVNYLINEASNIPEPQKSVVGQEDFIKVTIVKNELVQFYDKEECFLIYNVLKTLTAIVKSSPDVVDAYLDNLMAIILKGANCFEQKVSKKYLQLLNAIIHTASLSLEQVQAILNELMSNVAACINQDQILEFLVKIQEKFSCQESFDLILSCYAGLIELNNGGTSFDNRDVADSCIKLIETSKNIFDVNNFNKVAQIFPKSFENFYLWVYLTTRYDQSSQNEIIYQIIEYLESGEENQIMVAVQSTYNIMKFIHIDLERITKILNNILELTSDSKQFDYYSLQIMFMVANSYPDFASRDNLCTSMIMKLNNYDECENYAEIINYIFAHLPQDLFQKIDPKYFVEKCLFIISNEIDGHEVVEQFLKSQSDLMKLIQD